MLPVLKLSYGTVAISCEEAYSLSAINVIDGLLTCRQKRQPGGGKAW